MTCVHVHMYGYLCMCVCVCMCVQIWILVCVYHFMHVCICMSMCTCMLSVYSVYFPNAVDVYMYPLCQYNQSLMMFEDTGFSFSHVLS